MHIERIEDAGTTFALVVRGNDREPGLHFITPDESFQQVGIWVYDKGKRLGPHRHIPQNRNVSRTHEVVYVQKGKMRASIYDEENCLLKDIILNEDDLLIAIAGGHGYEILENDTQVIEVKNGPYIGEKDRETFVTGNKGA